MATTTLTDKLKELAEAKARLTSLEERVNEERDGEMKALPGRYGYASMEEFIAALKALGRKEAKAASPAAPKAGKARRAKVTDEIRAQVKKLVEAGKTGKEIAAAVGISEPTYYNVKKALGLTAKR